MSLSLVYAVTLAVFYALCVFIVATVVYEERDPSTTLAWVLAFLVFPVLGFVLYVLFGRDLRATSRLDTRAVEAEERGHAVLAPLYERHAEEARALVERKPALVARLVRGIRSRVGTEPLPCVGLELVASGADKFERLYADIRAARHHVHLEYFIWEEDDLTARFCDLLAQKVREGVEVRVLYDWLGSLPFAKTQLRQLKRSGAQVHADAAYVRKVNYRNHRKIAVVDGALAYTGGINFGQEYVDGGRRFESWRDTSVRFGGPLVADLQRLFAARWLRVTGEDLFGDAYFPPLDTAGGDVVWGQLAYSGADRRFEAIRQAFVIAIASAEERVRVQSPYFVPDQGVMDVLVAQSLAGTDVEFMMTGVPDKRLPWWAAFSYIDDLVEAGGTLYQYRAGFFHSKAMTIDGAVAVIGTTNFDIRSFSLHDELSLFFYDERVAAAQDALFIADRASCRAVTAPEVARLSRPVRFRNALARLASRVL